MFVLMLKQMIMEELNCAIIRDNAGCRIAYFYVDFHFLYLDELDFVTPLSS